MNSTSTTVRGKLDIVFRTGRYGQFPIATLHTPFGSFACRDKWLETLDAGSFSGEFEIDEITLTGYMTRGAVREQRTFIKAVVCAYSFDSMDDSISESEYATLDDPILDETPIIEVSEPVSENSQPEPADELRENETDEMVSLIRSQLRSVGNETEWNCGDAIAIPADLGRTEQRQIRDYLIANGYKMTNPMQRTWETTEEVTCV